MLVRLAAALLLVALLCPTAQADELTPAKQADIKLLLQASGGTTMGKQMAPVLTQQYVGIIRKTRPEIPARTLDIVEREIISLFTEKFDAPGGLVDRIVLLYAATFSHQELLEMLAFYQSPVGKKALAAMPGLMREGQKIGQDFARELGPEVKTRIKEALQHEGVVLDKMP